MLSFVLLLRASVGREARRHPRKLLTVFLLRVRLAGGNINDQASGLSRKTGPPSPQKKVISAIGFRQRTERETEKKTINLLLLTSGGKSFLIISTKKSNIVLTRAESHMLVLT